MARLPKRAATVVEAAKLRFGDAWQSPLARLSGVSPALLQKIASPNDPREVTDDVYRKVADALLKESSSMTKAAAQIERMAQRMLAEIESAKGG